MKKLYKGLILVTVISIISILLNKYILNFIETLTIGIIIGMIYSNVIGIKDDFEKGISFALKKILKWGIVLLGVKLNFNLVRELGPKILFIIITLVTISLLISYYIGKLQNLNSKLSILLGVGSSICGASAIVAMGPVIEADDEDIAISVTIISLLGAIGVIIYSFLSPIIPLTDLQYGIWAGSSLQGVAHSLAAAGARGTDSISLEIGTIVKMARVTLLAPVAVILRMLFTKNLNKSKIKFPMYVLYFIIVGIIFTINEQFNLFLTEFNIFSININIVNIFKNLSDFFILMAMVAMGLKVNFKSFEKKALKAFMVCSMIFLIVSLTSIVLITI